jgi:DNA-binding HxlR family transcriptional regulator
MRQRDYSCGLDAALDVIGGKWKVLIMWGLRGTALRFGELRRQVVGISEKILIQQLRELEQDGLITRTDHREVPPRVDYALTEFGATLFHALSPLCEWGQQHMTRIEACKQAQRHPSVDEPVQEAQVPAE